MAIVFDRTKRAKALADRGMDFLRCAEVFAGENMTREDDRQDYGERRYITISWLDARMIVIVWTPRNDDTRIVSMRKANEREQNAYGRRLARH